MLTVVIAPLLSLTIALALSTNVIAQHRTEDEILFRSELVERAGDNHTDSFKTLFLAKE